MTLVTLRPSPQPSLLIPSNNNHKSGLGKTRQMTLTSGASVPSIDMTTPLSIRPASFKGDDDVQVTQVGSRILSRSSKGAATRAHGVHTVVVPALESIQVSSHQIQLYSIKLHEYHRSKMAAGKPQKKADTPLHKRIMISYG